MVVLRPHQRIPEAFSVLVIDDDPNASDLVAYIAPVLPHRKLPLFLTSPANDTVKSTQSKKSDRYFTASVPVYLRIVCRISQESAADFVSKKCSR